MLNLKQLVVGWLAPCLVVCGLIQPLTAAELKPVVVVSIAPSERLLTDVGTITRSIGMPELGAVATLFATQYTQLMQPRQPLGVLLQYNGQEPEGLGFVAIRNFADVKQKIEENVDELQDLGNGIYKLPRGDKPLFLADREGWLFYSNKKEFLASTPKDPATLLGNLPKTYSVAVRALPQNLSEDVRQKAIAELEKGFEQVQGRIKRVDGDAQEALRKNSLEQLKSLVRETEHVTIGWGVDADSGGTFLDLSVAARPNSSLAEQMRLLQNPKTPFSGFALPAAAVTGVISSRSHERDIKQFKEMIATSRRKAMEEIDRETSKPVEDRTAAKEIVATVLDVAEATLDTGKVDAAGALVLEPESLTFVAGCNLTLGGRLDGALRRLVDLAKKEPKFPGFQFDADKVGDVRLHTTSIPLPEDERDARKLLGDKLDVVIGIGEKSAYFAFGRDGMNVLKTAIEKSVTAGEQATSPAKISVSLASILRFVKSVENRPEIDAMLNAVRRVPGKDHIHVAAQAIENGVTYRLDVEEGVLQVIGQAAKNRQIQN